LQRLKAATRPQPRSRAKSLINQRKWLCPQAQPLPTTTTTFKQ
jgi:hypothetical protein